MFTKAEGANLGGRKTEEICSGCLLSMDLLYVRNGDEGSEARGKKKS